MFSLSMPMMIGNKLSVGGVFEDDSALLQLQASCCLLAGSAPREPNISSGGDALEQILRSEIKAWDL
jgi:hypothetical protein